ncbi:MAG: terminase TerL endonuclease subunit [Phycisphaerales bacterium]
MAVATKTRGKTVNRRRTLAPKRWRSILCDIPGYDPFRDAEGCWFDADTAEYYISFIETCCTHIEGPLAGQPFLLERWEKAIVGNLFGWMRKDAKGRTTRRYRRCLIYVPRKNGKTPLTASIHNAIFFLDREAGQINNIAAASRDQASKLYRHIVGMINAEPEMAKRCQQFATTRCLTKPDNSVTKVIPADENVAHGDNPHFQAIDELHAQPNPKLYNALTSAMVSMNRLQPLLLMLTTADYDRPSVCNDEYNYACKVRDGIVSDATYLPVIYEAMHKDAQGRPVEDDWNRADSWYKANPNMGVSVSREELAALYKRAKEDISKENEFKRLHLNIRTQQDQRVIQMEAWDACQERIDWPTFAGRSCWAALDIGALRDFVSLVIGFPGEIGEPVTLEVEDLHGEKKQLAFTRRDYWLRHYCWLPEQPPTRDPRMEAQIDAWSRQGHIIRTPGNVVDYDQVGADIARLTKPYGVVSLAIDQGFQGMQITQDLQRIFGESRIVAFRQGILSMAAPFRELMQLLMLGRLHHDGDPVLRWMASNVAAETRGGLIKPSKDKSPEKIDGITAATMMIGIAMTTAAPAKSVYETRGIRTIGGDDERED